MVSESLSYIEINANNLIHNIEQIRKRLPVGNRLIAVVKANAYGHGLKEVVASADAVVDAFQIDDIEELREARKYTDKQIFVFGYVMKSQLAEIVDLRGTLGVYTLEHIQILNQIGKEKGEIILVHLKIDALLGRQGILVHELDEFIEEIKKLSFIKVEAIYSHFSNIEDTDSLKHAHTQHNLLLQAKDKIVVGLGVSDLYHHVSATGGFLVDQENNWGGTCVRLGIGLYGLWPSKSLQVKYGGMIELRPILRWITHVAQIKNLPEGYPIGYGLSHITARPTRVAIIPQGYSDGYDRRFSNNGEVLIRGKRCSILGRVAMNMFVVDGTDIPDIAIEDEVVLIGSQEQESISAEYIADKINTVNYEIVARLLPLLKRVIV